MRAVMASEGVACVGIHNILKAPAWLHVTTPDEGRRTRSWDYFRGLIDLCADFGGDGLMIFGSSKQRNTVDGATREEATDRLAAGLAEVAPHAEARGVRILMEPLAPHLCDVVNTLDEAVAIVEQVGSPAVQSMFDTHNAVAETLPTTKRSRSTTTTSSTSTSMKWTAATPEPAAMISSRSCKLLRTSAIGVGCR